MKSQNYFPIHINALSLEINAQKKSKKDIRCILNNIDIRIEEHGITAIIGPNGAGKSMLIKCILNLITPTEGSVEWNIKPSAPEITFVPQKPVLLDRSVFDNIKIPLKHNRVSDFKEQAIKALNWANIFHLKQQFALTLSSGEQQLLALARAWALKPSILVLDEPSANLDPNRFNQINELIENLSQSCKIIMTSHSIQQVQKLANDIILLEDGSLLTQVDSLTFFNSPNYQKFIGKI